MNMRRVILVVQLVLWPWAAWGAPCTAVSVAARTDLTFNWTFSSEGGSAECGQFANGDWWVAPGPGRTRVTLEAAGFTGAGRRMFLDENPQLEETAVLSQQEYGNEDPSEDLMPGLPATFDRDASLLAAVEKSTPTSGACGTTAIQGGCVYAYNVVTVLRAVPPGGGADILRPSLDEPVKELLSLSSDFDLARLPRESYLNGTNAAGFEIIRKRWSHHTEILSLMSLSGEVFSEGGRGFRADGFVDDYASGTSQSWHNDLMTLFSIDNALAEKRAALAAMLTYGKDLFYAVYDPDGAGFIARRNWASGAGQHYGKFPAAVLFAALASDGKYGDALRQVSATGLGLGAGNVGDKGPQELEQVNPGVNGPVWGDFPDEMYGTGDGSGLNRYWSNMWKAGCYEGSPIPCNTGPGKRTVRDPHKYIDGPEVRAGAAYFIQDGPRKSFLASMSLMPEMCEIVNYPLLTEYEERLVADGLKTLPDPCAPPDPREPAACDPFRVSGCRYYGLNHDPGVTPTWGPDPNNPRVCIQNGPGQNGRFPALNGNPVNPSYTSAQVESNWTAIRAEGTGFCAIGGGGGGGSDTMPPARPRGLRAR